MNISSELLNSKDSNHYEGLYKYFYKAKNNEYLFAYIYINNQYKFTFRTYKTSPNNDWTYLYPFNHFFLGEIVKKYPKRIFHCIELNQKCLIDNQSMYIINNEDRKLIPFKTFLLEYSLGLTNMDKLKLNLMTQGEKNTFINLFYREETIELIDTLLPNNLQNPKLIK